jgi:diguanylate cyclase (GGDEF)-like protein
MGCDLSMVMAHDVEVPPEIEELVKERISSDPDFYSHLLSTLIAEMYDEKEAYFLWTEIMAHKEMLTSVLGRNVGIRVATFDYLDNIKHLLRTPRIVEENELVSTLHYANYDTLTEIYNRRYFMDKLRQFALEQSVFSFAFLDLDGFKRYNDRHGHQAGDAVLQAFSAIMKEHFSSPEYLLGRYGGDEFMAGCAGRDCKSFKPVLDSFRQRIQEKFQVSQITVSIGVTEFPSDARDVQELIAKADELLYRVKEFGGNAVFRMKTVRFTFRADSGMSPKDVVLVGDFNNWDRKKNVMTYDETLQTWVVLLRLKPGFYRYKFLVDQNFWLVDRENSQYADDGFGGQCSVIIVKSE